MRLCADLFKSAQWIGVLLPQVGRENPMKTVLAQRKTPTLVIAERIGDAPLSSDTAFSDGQVWRDQHGNVWAYHYLLDGQHWMSFPGLASFCFDCHTDEVKAIPHLHGHSESIQETYHHSVLPMALQVRGMEVLHASAVLTQHGVVALCANSGTGKSTIAFGLGKRGYSLWADDTVVFEAAGSHLRSVPVPCQSYLLPDAAAHICDDRPSGTSQVNGTNPARVQDDPMPLSAVIVLQRLQAASHAVAVEAVRLLPLQAFPAVLPYAVCFSPGEVERKRSMMATYLELSARVPVFEIRFRPGLEHLPEVLDQVEQAVHKAVGG